MKTLFIGFKSIIKGHYRKMVGRLMMVQMPYVLTQGCQSIIVVFGKNESVTFCLPLPYPFFHKLTRFLGV